MTDKELQTQFIAIQGKLFAIIDALSRLIDDKFKGGQKEAYEMLQQIANTYSTSLLKNLESPDSDKSLN